ncbi:MAG: PHP domain-containing protein [Cetobacterium sp.]|uniref:PHP domain-containing protein n=1 Tax=Cetobacterium sp. TaxID=2071632 RepID=UPI003F2E2C5D
MNKKIKGDLHIHSTISDSDYTIDEIMKKARENSITHISITDHDTLLGNTKSVEIGKKYEIEVISGVEISAYDYKRDSKVHILGYGKLGKNVNALCKNTILAREKNSKKYFDIILEKGYEISWERIKELSGETGVFKQHVMLHLIELGYTDDIYGDLYKKIFKEEKIVEDIKYVDIYDALRAIKLDGGIAILAHPAVYKNQDLILELLKFGLDGIEIYHPKHSLEDIATLKKIADENNLIKTGGTDFHGNMDTKYNEIGSFYSDEEALIKILKKL